MLSPDRTYSTVIKGSSTMVGSKCSHCNYYIEKDEFVMAFYVDVGFDTFTFYQHADCIMDLCLQVKTVTGDFLELQREMAAS